jgi:hypothetical protein
VNSVRAELPSEAAEQIGQSGFQPLCSFFDVQQRHIAHTALDAAVIGSMKPAPLRSLFLIDALFFADAAKGTAKAYTNIDRHS